MLVASSETVTLQVALAPPLFVVQVMVAVPPATAVTLPSESTVATLVSEEVQLTFLFVAVSGLTVAMRVSLEFVLLPTLRERAVFESDTLVGGTSTLTSHTAMYPPSLVFTVISAFPSLLPETMPLSETVATLGLSVDQVTFLSEAFEGSKAGERTIVPPTQQTAFLGREMPFTGCVTETVHSALRLVPSAVVAVIFAVPGPTALTIPRESTVATAVFEDFHSTASV